MRHPSQTDTPLSADARDIAQAGLVRCLLIESSAESLKESQETLLRMEKWLASRAQSGEPIEESDMRLLSEELKGLAVLVHQGQHMVAAQLQAVLGPCWPAREEAGTQSLSNLSRFLTEI